MKLKAYPKYKPSGVEWLGDPPERWDIKRLKYLISTNDNALPETTDPDYEMLYVDISSIDPVRGIVNKEPFIFENAPSRARRIVKDGDTIVSTVRTYLRAIAPIDKPEDNLIVSTGFAVLRPRKILSRYLSYVMRSPYVIETIVSRSVGVSYPAINASEIGSIKISVPASDEQEQIVNFLDRETGKIDELISKKELLVERLKEKRTALISRVVTKGLNPNVRFKPSGVEWLGDVPEHWNKFRLSDLAKYGYKTFTDGDWIESPYITDDGVRLIQTGNIGIGHYKEQGYRYISEETFSELGCTEILPGDVLICRLADPVGRACIAPDLSERMITSVDVCILKLGKEALNKYLVYLFSSAPYLNYMSMLCRGGTRDRISRSMLGQQRLVLPSITEQQSTASYLDCETGKIDGLTEKVQTAIDKLKEYRTALISAAVTGKIDVREEVA